jgi:hypothetical protein
MHALLLAAALPLADLPADCPIDRTVYRLRGAPEFAAGFARQDPRASFYSDLAFWLRTPSRTYWFSMGSPSGYGGIYLAPNLDPEAASRTDDADLPYRTDDEERPLNVEFDAFRSDLTAYETPPILSDPAPAFLFSRRLGFALWYEWFALSGRDPSAGQESMPIGLFVAHSCGDGPG